MLAMFLQCVSTKKSKILEAGPLGPNWMTMFNTFGANWELSRLPPPPLALRLTNTLGQQVIITCAITDPGQLGDIETNAQFPVHHVPQQDTPAANTTSNKTTTAAPVDTSIPQGAGPAVWPPQGIQPNPVAILPNTSTTKPPSAPAVGILPVNASGAGQLNVSTPAKVANASLPQTKKPVPTQAPSSFMTVSSWDGSSPRNSNDPMLLPPPSQDVTIGTSLPNLLGEDSTTVVATPVPAAVQPVVPNNAAVAPTTTANSAPLSTVTSMPAEPNLAVTKNQKAPPCNCPMQAPDKAMPAATASPAPAVSPCNCSKVLELQTVARNMSGAAPNRKVLPGGIHQ